MVITKYFRKGSLKQCLSGEEVLVLPQTTILLNDGWAEVENLDLTTEEIAAQQQAEEARQAAEIDLDEAIDKRHDETHNHNTVYEAKNSNIQVHVDSDHAPSNAQKNSDITKAEIEAKLTGENNTHWHAGGGGSGLGYTINVQALTSSPVDAQTVYFGILPKAPITTANVSRVYIPKAGTIKVARIWCYSGTAGTNQAWSLHIRLNNTTDYLIATLSLATNARDFSNISLNIPVVAGDYFEIKGVQPTWATNPATTIYGGYIYVE